MKRLLTFLGFAAWMTWSFPAIAALCGTKSRPTARANCKCHTLVKRGIQLGRFKTKHRFRLKRECRKAAKVAKVKCIRQMRRAGRSGRVTFKWRRVGSYFRHVMGYKTGYCKIRYACYKRRTKVSGLRLTRKLYKLSGKLLRKKVRLSRSKLLRSVRKRCSKNKSSVVRIKLSKPRCSKKVCTVSWRCTYRKRKRMYWCK